MWVFLLIVIGIVILTIIEINKDKDRSQQASDVMDEFKLWKQTNGLEQITPKEFSVPGYGIYMFVELEKQKIFFWQSRWETTKLNDEFTELKTTKFSVDFSDLLKSEVVIERDESSKLGNAVVNGAIFGVAGAGAALLSSGDVSSIKVSIYTKDIIEPLKQVVIINDILRIGLNVKNDTDKKQKIEEAFDFANTINATILSIISKNNEKL